MVKLVAAPAKPGVESACCEQCRARKAAPRNEDSEPAPQPASNEDGVSCLCEGAVFDVTARQVMEHAIHSYWDVACIGESLQPNVPCLDRFANANEPPPSHDGGAFVRILNQSFLL